MLSLKKTIPLPITTDLGIYIIVFFSHRSYHLFYDRDGYFIHDRASVKGWSDADIDLARQRLAKLAMTIHMDDQVTLELR